MSPYGDAYVCLLLESPRLRRIDCRLGRRHDPADPPDAHVHRLSHVVRRASARLLFALLLAAALGACRGAVQPYESLSPAAANLRARFNADAGTVRIVLLPAPT